MTRALPAFACPSSFQPVFGAVVDDVVHQLKHCFSGLHSLYIAGSVARLQAVPGKSDLNVTMVVSQPLTVSEQAVLNSIIGRIEQQSPQVTAVKVTTLEKSEALDIATIFKWGFWLKHCCMCVYGDDLSSRFGCFEPCWDIGKAMNEDLVEKLKDSRQKIMATRNVSRYLGFCREVANKMIWSCYSLVFHRSGRLVLSIEQAAQQFLKYYPQHEVAIERLFILASGQQVPKKAVLFMINDFGQWIVSEFDKIDRKIG
ncbi:nucleotidyltransferase domain-containing protein [Photobacterium rosenbergii]|uniref:Nucleotidyltransferase domain-containing protein n=1 Tax=Photobacterium rosenbergii TaxID=294936 RepID=A0ABU3ZFY5_9GAMM|nr:nucleotidyltransferase domain-containing protein [Photobacterium rosenbergii]MDV5169024.1 nucleotidyltransferase domain-containing protein [Photobacterium rosenbergii]